MPLWTLRPATAADAEFLCRVYAQTRLSELAPAGWSAQQADAFLRSQFALQDAAYRGQFPGCDFDIVEIEGAPVGRLYVDRTAEEIRVVDIALQSDRRRRGVGTALLQALLAEAAVSGRRVALNVERHNPARDLYRRLGFVGLEDPAAVYLTMTWNPDAAAGGAGNRPPVPHLETTA